MYQFIERARSYDAVETRARPGRPPMPSGNFSSNSPRCPRRASTTPSPTSITPPNASPPSKPPLAADSVNRAIHAAPEIAFAIARQSITGVLLQANLPERVTHNDTKFNNVLLDDETGEGLCVIDLDTVMPGLVLYDFGDMVRTATSPASGRRTRLIPSHHAHAHVRGAGTRLSRLSRQLPDSRREAAFWPSPASSSPLR
jgi:hypothetical protein